MNRAKKLDTELKPAALSPSTARGDRIGPSVYVAPADATVRPIIQFVRVGGLTHTHTHSKMMIPICQAGQRFGCLNLCQSVIPICYLCLCMYSLCLCF